MCIGFVNVMSVSFKLFKCYTANILKQNKTLHNGIHTQIHIDLPWKP